VESAEFGRGSICAAVAGEPPASFTEEVTMTGTTIQPAHPGEGRKSRPRARWVFFAALLSALVLSAGAVSVASAHGSGHARVRTIHIVTTLTSAATNSAGLGGPGDIIAQVFAFRGLSRRNRAHRCLQHNRFGHRAIESRRLRLP
jgi:hypothetical protein